MRQAALVLAGLLAAMALPVRAADDATRISGPRGDCVHSIEAAEYSRPTTRYDHAILGDAVEWGGLRVAVRGQMPCRWGRAAIEVMLPHALVFEDIAPRLADVDGDGRPEIVTVETSLTEGARLTIWGLTEGRLDRLASTPHLGRTHRWLAPVAAADLDGDGRIEIAYVDRPHLAMILRIWRYADGRLIHVADRDGLTNHRIGEDFITSGLRICDGSPELVMLDAGWARIVAARLDGGRIRTRDLGPFAGRARFAALLACG